MCVSSIFLPIHRLPLLLLLQEPSSSRLPGSSSRPTAAATPQQRLLHQPPQTPQQNLPCCRPPQALLQPPQLSQASQMPPCWPLQSAHCCWQQQQPLLIMTQLCGDQQMQGPGCQQPPQQRLRMQSQPTRTAHCSSRSMHSRGRAPHQAEEEAAVPAGQHCLQTHPCNRHPQPVLTGFL